MQLQTCFSRYIATAVVRKSFQVNNTTFQAVRGDLTLEATHAIGMFHIVNPANSLLILGGGVAGAILRLGGSIIQQECTNWVQLHGPVAEGQSAYTGPGKLKCRYVIHTVGPRYSGSGPVPEALLSSAICSALQQAEDLNAMSVAIPAISSGIFGYPKRKCAETLVKSGVDWVQKRVLTKLELVRFVNIDEETVGHFEAVFDQFSKQN